MNANESSRWQYFILLNFAFPIGFLFAAPVNKLPTGIALTCAALLLYLAGLRFRRHTYVCMVGLLATAVALAFYMNPMYLYLAFLSADMLSRFEPKRLIPTAAAFAASAVAAIGHAGWFVEPALLLAVAPTLFGVCVLPFLIRASVDALNRYRDMAQRLEAAQSQVERMAQDAERRRIAGELHDTLGHTLTFIALKAELSSKLAGKDAVRAAAEMEEVRSTARTALKQMRELVTGMRIVRLGEETAHCRSLFAAADIELTLEGPLDEPPPCPVLHETILAMGLREAATNVVRHSRATACRIELKTSEERIALTVTDNGVGLTGAAARAGTPGTGWAAAKERLQLIDGCFSAVETASGGTRVRLEVPIVIRGETGASI
ncbi:sensor histidine kinase [Paenibacillus sp. TRM 82003]|nr:sensor histidine kinase [Paenibacillus sp. TRM 82003]